jgi:hypothetical protein
MAPPYEPADATAELLLHTRLSAPRYHRAETNRRNGVAYATPSRDERATLQAGLAALDV